MSGCRKLHNTRHSSVTPSAIVLLVNVPAQTGGARKLPCAQRAREECAVRHQVRMHRAHVLHQVRPAYKGAPAGVANVLVTGVEVAHVVVQRAFGRRDLGADGAPVHGALVHRPNVVV